MTERRQRLLGALVSTVAGLLAAAMIYLHPEGLHVPLLVPGAWVAFDPGVRECSVSAPFLSGIGSDLVCRDAFGIGAVIVAALLVWVVLRALRQR